MLSSMVYAGEVLKKRGPVFHGIHPPPKIDYAGIFVRGRTPTNDRREQQQRARLPSRRGRENRGATMAEDAVRNKIFEYKAVSTLLQQIFHHTLRWLARSTAQQRAVFLGS